MRFFIGIVLIITEIVASVICYFHFDARVEMLSLSVAMGLLLGATILYLLLVGMTMRWFLFSKL